MAYTQITRENAHTFKIGSAVEFNYGPMYGSERGEIVGFETTQWGTQLIARTESGEQKGISGFTNVGIGAYLVGAA